MPRVKPKEVSIFPNPCADLGHNYVPYNDSREDHVTGYYKEDRKGNRISAVVYAMLFCTKCGETKEISIVNRRR